MPVKYKQRNPTLHMLGKDKPLKQNRKSTFRQLAGAKKYECKQYIEFLTFRIENDYYE